MSLQVDLLGLMDIFGKKDVSADLGARFPYYMETEFVPYKLKSRQRSSSLLMVTLKNLTNEPVMSSIVVSVPKQIRLDNTGMTTEKEIRLGMMAPNEKKQSHIELFSDVNTDKGEYTITITAFVHYRDYGHVLNEMRKRTVIESV